MKIIFAGTESLFSLPPLEALLAAGHEIRAVVKPGVNTASGPTETIPLLPQHANHTIFSRAQTHGIPIVAPAAAPEADLIVVACFPRRLPTHFLQRARVAAINIHPSWLPEFRGPAPLFWQLRAGITELGVSIHHMSAELDAGAIIAQSRLALPEGASGPEADRLLSARGAELLLHALEQRDLPAVQQKGTGSYQSWPSEEDWNIPLQWRVQRAFNFIRGTEEWEHPYRFQIGDKEHVARSAVHYALAAGVTGKFEFAATGCRVGLADGWLHVT